MRRRGDKSSKFANAKVSALRRRRGVFIGGRGVPLRLLTRDDLSLFFQDTWCESRVSVFLGARDEALSLLEPGSRHEGGPDSSGFMGQG